MPFQVAGAPHDRECRRQRRRDGAGKQEQRGDERIRDRVLRDVGIRLEVREHEDLGALVHDQRDEHRHGREAREVSDAYGQRVGKLRRRQWPSYAACEDLRAREVDRRHGQVDGEERCDAAAEDDDDDFRDHRSEAGDHSHDARVAPAL